MVEKTEVQSAAIPDETIIELYWQRDERAIRETDRKYGHFLIKIAYGILHDRSDSEECQNDTYMGVWKAIPPAKPLYFRAFLTQILRRIAINRYKERKSKKRVPSELTVSMEDLSNTLYSGVSPEAEYSAKEVGRLISDYVRRLPDRQQFVFVGRFYLAQTVAEIAADLGITPSAVYKEIGKIKQGLKNYLKGNGVSV